MSVISRVISLVTFYSIIRNVTDDTVAGQSLSVDETCYPTETQTKQLKFVCMVKPRTCMKRISSGFPILSDSRNYYSTVTSYYFLILELLCLVIQGKKKSGQSKFGVIQVDII